MRIDAPSHNWHAAQTAAAITRARKEPLDLVRLTGEWRARTCREACLGLPRRVPVELIWWLRAHAETAVDGIFAGDLSATADAIANGVALRTSGMLAQWQERLRHYPDELARARIEDAALTWGGFEASLLLSKARTTKCQRPAASRS